MVPWESILGFHIQVSVYQFLRIIFELSETSSWFKSLYSDLYYTSAHHAASPV
jgi:hypothetical protein